MLFLPRDHQADLPAPPPLNRREAERGTVRTVSPSEDSLAFVAPPGPSQTTAYEPFSGDGYDRPANPARPRATLTKAAPIRTKLINGQIASKKLPKGKAKKAKPSRSPKESDFWQATSNTLTQVTSWFKPSASHSSQDGQADAQASSSATAEASSPSTKLQYPPSHGAARIGLTQAWSNNKKHLLYFGSPSEPYPQQGVQLDEEHCLAPMSCAHPPYFDSAAVDMSLPRLNLALFRRPVRRGPLLAHRPPQRGDTLAGQGQNTERHVKIRVLTAPNKGLFWVLCPMVTTQVPSLLVNAYSEIAGVVLGASPSYRGHNYFLAGDTSLLSAWLHGQGSDDAFYDLNYATDKQLMKALAAHPSAPISRSSTPNVIARPGKALGKLRLGATRKQIVDFLGAGENRSVDLLGRPLDNRDAMYSYLTYETYGVALNFYDDRLVAIETIEAQYHTPFGLGVGVDFEHSKFNHELCRHACKGYSEQGAPLIAAPGIEVELDNKGVIALMRITI